MIKLINDLGLHCWPRAPISRPGSEAAGLELIFFNFNHICGLRTSHFCSRFCRIDNRRPGSYKVMLGLLGGPLLSMMLTMALALPDY